MNRLLRCLESREPKYNLRHSYLPFIVNYQNKIHTNNEGKEIMCMFVSDRTHPNNCTNIKDNMLVHMNLKIAMMLFCFGHFAQIQIKKQKKRERFGVRAFLVADKNFIFN